MSHPHSLGYGGVWYRCKESQLRGITLKFILLMSNINSLLGCNNVLDLIWQTLGVGKKVSGIKFSTRLFLKDHRNVILCKRRTFRTPAKCLLIIKDINQYTAARCSAHNMHMCKYIATCKYTHMYAYKYIYTHYAHTTLPQLMANLV